MGKGADTKDAILDRALALARGLGLEGVTLGTLASKTGLSKSGLFAHFQSKEKLQLQILELGAERFVDEVFRPALKKARGLPRIRALFEKWLAWANLPGGCLFLAASVEFDDQPGPVRDELVRQQKRLLGTLQHSAELAIEERHFAKGLDTAQFAWELHSILAGYHLLQRLLSDPRAEARAHKAFEALIERSSPKS
jgi:AcrR family transcriptional regulator